jgi:glycosyltransferase involved in cell wall biosynthesis
VAIVGEAVTADPAANARAPRAPLRVAAVGVSIDDPCGVRDHAQLLARALAADGVSSTSHWLSREATTLGAARAELAEWSERLAVELDQARPDALLLHYSVFAFSHRGVPLFVGPVLAAMRQRRAPIVCVMHEFAYPWRLGGARGKVWAATQRVALAAVMRAAASIVVTADARARWLRGRPWLPRRPVLVAPVFSNLPQTVGGSAGPDPQGHAAGASRATDAAPAARAASATIGLFGYAHEGVAVETVLDALCRLREGGRDVTLVLLGAPGNGSPAAYAWSRAARARGVAELIGFSGTLPAHELAAALTRCDVLLFAERGGPTSRKTTLAASLASGRPVVALDGHSTWSALAEADAALVVAPQPQALAEAVARLLADPTMRARQGERGGAFASLQMSAAHSARVVERAIARALGREAEDGAPPASNGG